MKNSKNGFIALFSVIIITSVLLISAVALSFTGFLGRFNVFDSELKAESGALAEACIEYARLQFAEDESFSGEGEVDVGEETCEYDVSGDEIKSWASVNNVYTYYFAEVDLNEPDIPIVSFKECPELSTCP